MPKLARDVSQLFDRSVASATLAIELFNRPSEVARVQGVLLLLHHAFEMLLKAIILKQTGHVHEGDGRHSYSFSKCLHVAEHDLKVLDPNQTATLEILDAQRDTAMHYFADVSEDVLYLHVQSGVTLFNGLLKSAFGRTLAEYLPGRVLPVSSKPPRDITILFDRELEEVDALLRQGSRRGAEAAAKLRSILPFATATRAEVQRVTEHELTRAVRRRRRGDEWQVILPEIAQLKLSVQGAGIPITMRLTKDGDIPVRIARPGEEAAATVAKVEVNVWDKYNLGLGDIAGKLGLTSPRTLAVVYDLGLQDDPECFHTLRRKRSVFKGYSLKALQKLREALENGIDAEAVWARQKHRFR